MKSIDNLFNGYYMDLNRLLLWLVHLPMDSCSGCNKTIIYIFIFLIMVNLLNKFLLYTGWVVCGYYPLTAVIFIVLINYISFSIAKGFNIWRQTREFVKKKMCEHSKQGIGQYLNWHKYNFKIYLFRKG